MRDRSRTIIIGLDGVPYRLLKDLASRGVMPNVRSLIAEGCFAQMQSTIPEVSSVAWSSIITGKGPAYHGIFGFTDIPAGTYRLSFPNFNSLQYEPFWTRSSGRSIILNVPSTFPAREMNGVHISGFVSLDLEKSVYPATLIPKLKQLDYRIDVDAQKAHSSFHLFLNDLQRTLEARKKVCRYLFEHQDWQTFMIVFTGTDRLMHFLWDAYDNSHHPHHKQFLEHFSEIDEIIGEIVSEMKDDDVLVMISDHGFEALKKNIYINFLLKKEGFLKLCSGKEENFFNIDYGTKAFSLDPGRIYINIEGKYPRGGVRSCDVGKVVKELIELFESVTIDGKKVFQHIFLKEEIYEGPLMNSAPDLVLVGAQGFNLHSSMKTSALSDKGIFTGKHTWNDAFLLIKDAKVLGISQHTSVVDVIDIIETIHKERWVKL